MQLLEKDRPDHTSFMNEKVNEKEQSHYKRVN